MIDRISARRPAEGWTTLVLVLVLGIVLAWAIDDPAWVNGHGELTDYLATCAIAAVLIGFAGPKLGWGRWTTHLVGAGFAALVIPILAGQAALPGASIGQAFHFTAEGSVNAYLDLAWRQLRLTSQEIHYSVVLGIIVWGTMQFASYAVFGHRRPLAAVVVIGIVLVLNMGMTDHEQLNYMIVFTGASLFLLIQMHAFDERATWIRRRIGDPSTISALYLRGGTIFIVAAMLISVLFTNRAASAPLAGAWSGVGNRLVGVGQEISRLLPLGGALRPLGHLTFGSEARISSKWFSDDRIEFTATVPKGFEKERYRAATYDTYEGSGWVQSTQDVASNPVAADQPLLDVTGEPADPDLTAQAPVTITPADYGEDLLLAPGAAVSVNRATDVETVGEQRSFVDVRLADGAGGPYQVTAARLKMPDATSTADEGITQNKLRVAGQRYPQDILDRYTQFPTGAIGPNAHKLLEDVLTLSASSDPYDIAAAMEKYLHSPAFQYKLDVTDVDCGTEGTVECFAQYKEGFCLHYATTMAILLRDAIPNHPIPTRLVQGFLSGDVQNGTSTVRMKDAHAWVEVYFPTYGWIPFDPTGQVGHASSFPPGKVVAPPSQLPELSFGPNDRNDQNGPSQRPGGPAGTVSTDAGRGGPTDRALLIILAVMLAAGVIAAAFAAWLRGPRGELNPDAAWRTMSRTASRFGFAPRPTQTVYEYAASLGELVPIAEHDIHTIATAKVETSYAGLRIGGARLDAVRDATRRLRISLLRLAFRRPRRRRRG